MTADMRKELSKLRIGFLQSHWQKVNNISTRRAAGVFFAKKRGKIKKGTFNFKKSLTELLLRIATAFSKKI